MIQWLQIYWCTLQTISPLRMHFSIRLVKGDNSETFRISDEIPNERGA